MIIIKQSSFPPKITSLQRAYRFFLLLQQAPQLYCKESLHLPGHPLTAAVLRTVIKGAFKYN
jgi:hypothetical protein